MRTPQANFPGILMLEVQGITEGPMWDRMKGNLLDLRGDDHRRQRKLVQHAFTPKEADKLRPLMRQELEKMWDAVAADGGCDFVDAFAKPYPGAHDRRRDGLAARGRPAARALGEPDPEAVRPGRDRDDAAHARAGVDRVRRPTWTT